MSSKGPSLISSRMNVPIQDTYCAPSADEAAAAGVGKRSEPARQQRLPVNQYTQCCWAQSKPTARLPTLQYEKGSLGDEPQRLSSTHVSEVQGERPGRGNNRCRLSSEEELGVTARREDRWFRTGRGRSGEGSKGQNLWENTGGPGEESDLHLHARRTHRGTGRQGAMYFFEVTRSAV